MEALLNKKLNKTAALNALKSFSSLTNQVARSANGITRLCWAIANGYWLAYKGGALKKPGQPEHQVLVGQFCQGLCDALELDLKVYGEVPTRPALWVSNHISWTDIGVLGSKVPAFFLAKAEMQHWPIFGALAQAGGTLFIKRGSGDSGSIRAQLAQLLKDQMSIIIFPEATTTDGTYIKRIFGRLLPAASEAGVPIQAVILAYTNAKGELDSTIPFIDDTSIADHVKQIVATSNPITAHMLVLPAIETANKSEVELANELQLAMENGLKDLHQMILKNN